MSCRRRAEWNRSAVPSRPGVGRPGVEWTGFLFIPTSSRTIRRVKPLNVLPSARVFPRAVSNRTRQLDFERAGIPLVNDYGEHADLHALRVTFGTRLALAGVPPAVLQRLMRHSTIELTMRYYTKLGTDDLESHGIDLLPGLEAGPDHEQKSVPEAS